MFFICYIFTDRRADLFFGKKIGRGDNCYKLIVEEGDVTQAFKVPMRLIQKPWTLFIEGTLAFRLLGNREKSAFMFSFHVNLLPFLLFEQIFIERDVWV